MLSPDSSALSEEEQHQLNTIIRECLQKAGYKRSSSQPKDGIDKQYISPSETISGDRTLAVIKESTLIDGTKGITIEGNGGQYTLVRERRSPESNSNAEANLKQHPNTNDRLPFQAKPSTSFSSAFNLGPVTGLAENLEPPAKAGETFHKTAPSFFGQLPNPDRFGGPLFGTVSPMASVQPSKAFGLKTTATSHSPGEKIVRDTGNDKQSVGEGGSSEIDEHPQQHQPSAGQSKEDMIKAQIPICILYFTSCSSHHDHSKGKFSLDFPKLRVEDPAEGKPARLFGAVGSDGHTSTLNPIKHLDDFLAENRGIEALILRVHKCPGSTFSENTGSEFCFLLSENFKVIFQHMSRYAMATVNDFLSPAKEFDFGTVLSNQNQRLKEIIQKTLPSDVLVMTSPYYFALHHLDMLDKFIQKKDENEDFSDFKETVAFLLEDLEESCPYFATARALLKRKKITTSMYEALYHPNSTVIWHDRDEPVVLVVSHVERRAGDIVLRCWQWIYTGTVLERGQVDISMWGPPSVEMDLATLGACPVEHADPKLLNMLEDRGRKFWKYRTQKLVTYSGWDTNQKFQHVDVRFMLDTPTYYKLHPNIQQVPSLQRTKHDSYGNNKWTIDTDGPMPANSTLIKLPYYLHGFNLKDKCWMQLSVNSIEDIKWNKQAFDRLILPNRSTKDLIKALILTQNEAKKDDFVAGKGNGLILLLHGGPGTGKTLTAESVAELSERPLYYVTCGDIGTDLDAVEKYLASVLYLGKIWNCVLLFDEADIFLEERNLSDFHRNSLVSVFLRNLEYYDGILVLTSNRVGTFDEAFTSRIQMAIHYQNLTRVSRKKIWQNFFDMLEENEVEADFAGLSRHLDELAEREMNGRQIRNAISTAKRLAGYQNEKLTWTHLDEVIKVSGEFGKYLEDVRGHTDEDRARDTQLR